MNQLWQPEVTAYITNNAEGFIAADRGAYKILTLSEKRGYSTFISSTKIGYMKLQTKSQTNT